MRQKLQHSDILPLHDAGWLDRGQVARSDVPNLLPRCDTYGLSKEVCLEIARLKRHGQIIRYEDYTFPKVKRGYAMRHPQVPIEVDQKLETLRSLYNGCWASCVPHLAVKIEKRILATLSVK